MVVSIKIRLLFRDMRFLPSGSDISDTCLRHSHLHETYAYYIAPTCWLPCESSSLVAGNNSNLLLPVMWHHASAVIYVHRTIVFWPRGHVVCLWLFQLYDTRSIEPPPMPIEPKPGACQEAPLQMKDSLNPPPPPAATPRLNLWNAVGNTWPSCWKSQRGLHLNEMEPERLEWFTSLRSSSRRACPSLQLFTETSHFAITLSSVSSTCCRSGREGKVSDMTSSEVSMSGTTGDWGGTNAEEGDTCSTHASQSAMKCNLAPIGLGLQGASIDLSL